MTEIEQDIYDWLSTKPYSLWGPYLISDPPRRERAAKWFAKELQEFSAWHEARVEGEAVQSNGA